ncbi:NhaP-type Na+/H+ and K+/H+ antiporter [Rubidibacter lacunae KORDI 51-2]|uniref:NhaP-type Na+/H+ and K+/H+ antiporter n=1 Tax=Rubidibacter lacunae KORDI 51-2 TaxID=582515 RepID=U5DR79_9CHRO|nr:sodium:proton antiporter [Rubidibacter lacunae]ERN42200.1 NhaP-type Na+/H+ and K+/H+ antiporter [Rubidibacter lacunae KORDI 51-2]
MSAEMLGEGPGIQQSLEQFLVVLSISLGVATLSQIVSWFRRVPYTLLLVVVGLGLAFVDVRLVNLSPELILEIFLPPLLFEAAWNIQWRNLKENLLPVGLFATLGVAISIATVALGLSTLAGVPLEIALLVGAALSATDPVSVVALFRELGAGERLTVLMEGESLFNDGVAVVAFVLLVGIPLGTETFELTSSLARFVTFVGVGVGVGAALGFGISYLTQRFDLPLVEQSLTLVSAYGTYLIAEKLGGSGVIGVVTVGLILGNFGSRIGMNPRTRLIVSKFWEFIAFFVNSIVFLLIGDQIDIVELGDAVPGIATVVGLILAARAVGVFGLSTFHNLLSEEAIGWREQIVLWWGGLRGGVSIALALSVPVALAERQDIIEAVFGAVLFTLLVEGLTTRTVLEKLGLVGGDRALSEEYSELLAQGEALRRVQTYLKELDNNPEIDAEYYSYQKDLVDGEVASINDRIVKFKNEYPQLRMLEQEQLRKRLLDIEADTYAEYIRTGQLSKELSPWVLKIIVEADAAE